MQSKLFNKQFILEASRFLAVGFISTAFDFFIMFLFLKMFENIIFNTTLLNILGSQIGFILSTILNYFLTILIVYRKNKSGKDFNGFFKFFVLSILGLTLNSWIMYIGFDTLNINEWIVKIFATAVVLVLNFVLKRFLVFNVNNEKIA